MIIILDLLNLFFGVVGGWTCGMWTVRQYRLLRTRANISRALRR